MIIEYSARSYVGIARENNEDNLYVDGTILPLDLLKRTFAIDGNTYFPAIFAVCDGMGGEENGELASLLTVQVLSDCSEKIKIAASRSPSQINVLVQSFIDESIDKIHAEAVKYGSRMGTTLALVVASKDGIHCFNIGDSRIYVLHMTVFKQLTNDHTVISGGEKNGSLTPDQTMAEKYEKKLTRCIGIGDVQIAENYPPIVGNCRILICSDGLSDMVSSTEIEHTLRVSGLPADATTSLLKLALENGGWDNISVIVVDIKVPKASYEIRKVLRNFLRFIRDLLYS